MTDKYNQKWVSYLLLANGDFRALTINQTTYYSCGMENVGNKWRRHENTHKLQWYRDGCIKFVVKYLWYQLRYGSDNNPYEIEARNA